MPKIIKISTEHSSREDQDTVKIYLKMMGGCPYFAYVWIDDICFTIRAKKRGGFGLVKTK